MASEVGAQEVRPLMQRRKRPRPIWTAPARGLAAAGTLLAGLAGYAGYTSDRPTPLRSKLTQLDASSRIEGLATHRLSGLAGGGAATANNNNGAQFNLAAFYAVQEPNWVLQVHGDDLPQTEQATERWFVHSVGYPPLSSATHYPWSYIVEPHRETVIWAPVSIAGGAIRDGASAFRWTVTRLPPSSAFGNAGKEEQEDSAHSEAALGAEVLASYVTDAPVTSFFFYNATREYEVTVEARLLPTDQTQKSLQNQNDNAAAPARVEVEGGSSATVRVMCKYARREIRLLTDEDRDRYFSAFAEVASVPAVEGRRLYGAAFKNLQYMMVKHIHNEQCSPFHNGNGFFTSHAALTLELEQALQAVDPSVAHPLWDFTIDQAAYGNEWFKESPMFLENWFGSATPQTLDRAVRPSWLPAGIPVPKSYDRPVRNSYGLITNNINNNPSPLVTRSHEFCGLENKLPLPGCMEYLGCMTNEKTLSGLRACCEGELHRDMHMGIGGEWDCKVDFGQLAANDSRLAPILGKVGIAAVKLHNSLWSGGYLVIPERCDSATPFESCRASCPALDPCAPKERPTSPAGPKDLSAAAAAAPTGSAAAIATAAAKTESAKVSTESGDSISEKAILENAAGGKSEGSAASGVARQAQAAVEEADSAPKNEESEVGLEIRSGEMAKNVGVSGTEVAPSEEGCAALSSGVYMEFDAAFAILEEVGIVSALKKLTEQGSMEFEGRSYNSAKFTGLDDQTSRTLWVTLLQHACHPGKFGNMGTGASSGDVIFWPLHPFFDRMWAYMRLNRDETFSEFDWGWEDDVTACYGHNSGDAMPFRGLFGEEGEAAQRYYINTDLVRLFDPKNPALPYVYADFDWAHCQQVDVQAGREAHQAAAAAAAAASSQQPQQPKSPADAISPKNSPALSADGEDPTNGDSNSVSAASEGSQKLGTGGAERSGKANNAPAAPPRVDKGAQQRRDGPQAVAGGS